MNLQHLYYFQSLAETEHYAKSAELLHTSASNLSYAISTLEQELGISLFRKSGRNIMLTSNGKLFLQYVTRALNELEEGKAACGLFRSEAGSRRIRIAAFRLHAVNSIIQAYTAETSILSNIQLDHMRTEEIIDQLISHKLDIGFCTYYVNKRSLSFFPVEVQQIVALIHPDHPLASMPNVTIYDVAKYPIIVPRGSDGMRSRIMDIFRVADLTPQIACQAESINAAANLSSFDRGITLTVGFSSLTHFNVKIVPVTQLPKKFYLYAAYANDIEQSGPVSDMIAYLKDVSKAKFSKEAIRISDVQ